MSFTLLDTHDYVQPDCEDPHHQLKFLERNGRCPTLHFLEKECAPDDYSKLVKVMNLVVCHGRVRNEKHVRRGNPYKDIYEMRADKGKARLFFFYLPSKDFAICIHGCNKPKRKVQDQEFAKAEIIRRAYLDSIGA